MTFDIVVDANVMMHADNQQEPRQEDAKAFLIALQESTTKLCVDEGFHVVETSNRSKIGSEYLKHLIPGMLGFAVVSYLARNLRVKAVTRKVPENISRKIRMNVKDRSDHVYVRVAFNSHSRDLASHDFHAFPTRVRDKLEKEIFVQVICADEALQKVRGGEGQA